MAIVLATSETKESDLQTEQIPIGTESFVGQSHPDSEYAEDENEELDFDDFDEEDFDDEFDDDFEEEAEDEYDVVEEFENDFVFVDPAEKKKASEDDGKEGAQEKKENSDDDKGDGKDDKDGK
ncbi:MAG: hypothetical protein CMJ76_01440 [Planctomycetaceae bacterium]|nr:hypothetical protein [Planctomycetaceae bacterium]|tara:strand:- start:1321 stop:1689 length:369 start_codon:yes stop_codon:yes gene_type:complete